VSRNSNSGRYGAGVRYPISVSAHRANVVHVWGWESKAMRFSYCVFVCLFLLPYQIFCASAESNKAVEQLVGTWVLVSITGERDGAKTEPWGNKPRGILVLSANGRFAQIQLRNDLPKFASGNRTKGTPDEFRSISLGSLTYFGTYTVSDKGTDLLFKIEASSFPNLNGDVNVRPFRLTRDELVTINPASQTGGSSVTLTWQRDK